VFKVLDDFSFVFRQHRLNLGFCSGLRIPAQVFGTPLWFTAEDLVKTLAGESRSCSSAAGSKARVF
jgi:hypothetical protein